MITPDVFALSITELAAAYRSKSLSPVEVTQACLERIERLDGKFNAFVTVTADLALQQARRAEAELGRGQDRGPLQGVPIALKDLYSTKGVRTTAHSKVLLDWVPTEDATTTAKLAEAGSVLLGKLAMHEFAFSTPGFDTPFPPARNPWDLNRITGGSSSGSGAALAALLCYGSLGSDTGGSIRNPAHLCGITGIKPTYGRVSRYGVVPLSWSLDHCGPMTRTVEDCAIMLQAIAGYDPKDAACADLPVPDYRAALAGSVRGLKAGVPRKWFEEGEGNDPDVNAAFDAAVKVLQDAGVQVQEVDATPFIEGRWPNTAILVAEAYAYHERTMQQRPYDLGRGLRSRLYEGAFLTAADYVDAQRARTVLAAQMTDIMQQVDVVLSPGGPRPAATFEAAMADPEAAYRSPSYTHAFNLSGLPAICVPCGFTSGGLPTGLQIAGRAFDEATVLKLAHVYQQATDWHTRHPDLPA